MFPLLLLLGAAAAFFAMSSSGKTAPPGPTVIPGPAGANIFALPPGSIVMTKDHPEAIVIQSQGPLGYFGHTMVSGAAVTFAPGDIAMVQSVGPLAMPALPPLPTLPAALPTLPAALPTLPAPLPTMVMPAPAPASAVMPPPLTAPPGMVPVVVTTPDAGTSPEATALTSTLQQLQTAAAQAAVNPSAVLIPPTAN